MKSLAIGMYKGTQPRSGSIVYRQLLLKVKYHLWRNVIPTALILILGSLLTLAATKQIWEAKNPQPTVAATRN